jgi:MATE family multidrug resistance protein
MADIFRIGWPAGAMFANEMVCWAYLMVVLLAAGGRAAGEDPTLHNTAGWIGLRYMHLSFMPAVGLSVAMTAIVGKCMGMGRPDLAMSRAWLGVRIGLIYMGVCAVCFFVFRVWMIERFVPESMDAVQAAEIVRIGSTALIAAAVFQLFDAVAIVLSGALRGAGDTVWPGVATILLSWTCIIGGGHAIIALAPGLGSLGPWIGTATYLILLGTALMVRFVSGRWKSIVLVDAAEPERT